MLPNFWIIKNDWSQLFKDTVIKYLNEICDEWIWELQWYYWYDWNDQFKWTGFSYSISIFENSPTLLTLNEFIQMTTEEFKRGEIVTDNDWTEAEFICDLWEKDDIWGRFVIRWNKIYYLASEIHKIEETIEINWLKYKLEDIKKLKPL